MYVNKNKVEQDMYEVWPNEKKQVPNEQQQQQQQNVYQSINAGYTMVF